MSRQKNILHYSFSFLLATLLLAACENDLQKVKDLNKKNIGIEEGVNIESYLSQAGKMKAQLTAPLLRRYMTDTIRVDFPNTLHVNFYDSSLAIESTLFAKYGTYNENDNKVLLRDSVIVINTFKKDTLKCQELYWDQSKNTFYTDKPISISQSNPRQKIYGLGLTADQNFKWFTIHKIGRIHTGFDNYLNIADTTF